MSKESTVSVVVLNWNGKRFIDDFLETLSKQTYDKKLLDLVFVDNASSDNSVDYFKKSVAKYDISYTLVQNDKNYGYAGGNNKGLASAKGEYVLICNNDLTLNEHLIEELIAVAKKKKADAVVPKLVFLNKPGVINNAGSEIDTNSDWPVRETGFNEKDTGQYEEIRSITAFCGACVLFKRSFLETVGLFDGKFFMYFEDADLSWRGLNAGKKYFYAPKAVAHHVHTGSSKEGSPLFNHYVGRNRLLIMTKNGKFSYFIKAWVATLRDHLLLRVKHLALAVANRYPRRSAIKEFWLSQKMIWSAILLTPYALAKRLNLIKESTL